MNIHTYFLLFIAVSSGASAFTYMLSTIISDTWTSVFITSVGWILFILENIEINKQLQLKDVEIRVLKETSQATLFQRTTEFNYEIRRLKKAYMLGRVGGKSF